MSEPFLGQVIMFAGNFAPRGWALCEGQLLPISSNSALFSILGTTYGGDGRTTFALPDLRGRVPFAPGTGHGLSTYRLGQRGGVETNSTVFNHTHELRVSDKRGDDTDPDGSYLAVTRDANYTTNSGSGKKLAGLANTGTGTPIPNIQPYLAINFIIALQGTFPSRS